MTKTKLPELPFIVTECEVPNIHGVLTVRVNQHAAPKSCVVCQSASHEPIMTMSEFEGIFGSSSVTDEINVSPQTYAENHTYNYLGVPRS